MSQSQSLSSDATFEDGAEAPLRLMAQDAEDLTVLSALLQDAVLPITEMKWQSSKRRFSLLANRFRWEDVPAAERRGRAFERVQAVLAIDSVLRVKSQGLVRSEHDTVLSLLAISFEPGEDGAGVLTLQFAGDGAIALDVEAIDASLTDVTRPYLAPSKSKPSHSQV
ncbi:MAG: DUF2948 family protein [Pseudomonadota bacterium]